MNMNPSKNIAIITGIIVIAAILVFVIKYANYSPEVVDTDPVACTMEAKMCPDGSYVGRQGPRCEFKACPTPTTTSVTVPVDENVTLAVGEKKKIDDLTITLNSFVQDSRCPIDVVCIQAGAVTVNVTLADSSHYITKNFPSDEIPYSFGKYRISIVDIAPPRQNQKEILPSQYRITFHVTSDTGNELDKTNLIRVDYPKPDQTITSPLIIKGTARGNWFFGASFPVVLTDWDGRIIADGIATAKSNWMTADFVPFEATLTFSVDKDVYSRRGSLILKKDNPSGLPEYDDALEIPVVFE